MIQKEQIIFEDNHLIIINKKPSEIVQGDKTGDMPLSEKVKNYIKQRDQKPGNVFVGVCHRLDRPVSGIVIFAKTSKALSRMNELFRDKTIQKTYWAVVKNKPAKPEAHLVHYMLKNEKTNTSKAFNEPKKDSLKAELSYKLIASISNYHLLEVRLYTGRHHQIRAQLAAIGSPIKGDVKYGFDRTNATPSIHLHSYKAEFIHPVKKEKVTVTCNPPLNDTVWNELYKAIKP
ncbi:MAG: RNA pseudouridine synthase [Bacteroidetes bacterium]|nr:RNA pseudouridine synthase [Bacteroidota bacterium]